MSTEREMKASEVIKRLEKLMQEHGDKAVMFHGPYSYDEGVDRDSHIGMIVAYDKQGNSAKDGNCDHFYLHLCAE